MNPSRYKLWLSLLAIFLTALPSENFHSSAEAQTFLDRQNADSFRIVSYNVLWDTLFEGSGVNELGRMITAVDADVYNFQEADETSSSEVLNLFNSLAPLENGSTWQAHKGRNQLIVSRHDLSLQQTNVPGGTRGIAMAQVDLPDANFDNDLFLLNNHFPCCDNETGRRNEATAISNWLHDATHSGGSFNLAPGTAIAMLGDLNIVGGPTPLNILIDGVNGQSPDWDDTSLVDAHPVHNASGNTTWTWRNDQSFFDPGVLDYVLFTDSVIELDYGYVLNPSQMSSNDLLATGLRNSDFMRDKNVSLNVFDHLPLVVDFAPNADLPGDFDGDGDVDIADVDFYVDQIGLSETDTGYDARLDLNNDGAITLADHDQHITTLMVDANGTGALIGDLNLDGDVDVSEIIFEGGVAINNGDASTLLANLGTTTGALAAHGDLNSDGDVDVSQILFEGGAVVNVGDASRLLANLGQNTAGGAIAASSVPEPGSLIPLALAGLGFGAARRKRS